MVILDTNVIIDHLRQPPDTESLLIKLKKKIDRDRLAISMITIQELYVGKSTKRKEDEKNLLAVVGALKILEYSYEVAKLAGELERDLNLTIEFSDAAIAATAIVNGAELVTLNRKHFEKIAGLELFHLKAST